MDESTERICLVCSGSMAGKRPHAVYCSRACKSKASEERRKVDGRAAEKDRKKYQRSADQRRDYARRQGRQLRDRVLDHYGRACLACGSGKRLELDHVNGNGEAHRDAVGHGDAFFRWILAQDFPAECEWGGDFELQPLCRTCHESKTKRERAAKRVEGGDSPSHP